ncbi:MAG TPA: recombination mediator RecR [Elusimicrobiales bacterium]|nr:recombination mediator RecR [Elusimicrobiales bacterium]
MKSLDKLINLLKRLPGVGPRQAERFSNYFMQSPSSYSEEVIASIKELKSSVRLCKKCFTWSEYELCPICTDDSRDVSILCVVEEPQDIEAIEKTKIFNGFYHVLGGAISHVDGVGIDNIRIKQLVERIESANGIIKEIIIAVDPDTEGEATALYLADLLRRKIDKITRIAYGVPLGGDLDYTDEMTLTYALKGRTNI